MWHPKGHNDFRSCNIDVNAAASYANNRAANVDL
jgi:hypothetical protein